jgi:hypothetical protein
LPKIHPYDLIEGAGSPTPFQGWDESDPRQYALLAMIFENVAFDRLC